MENLEFNLEEILSEIRSRMETQGAMTREAYLDLAEEVLEEKRADGLLDDDEDFKQAQEALEARWEDIAETLDEERLKEEKEEDEQA